MKTKVQRGAEAALPARVPQPRRRHHRLPPAQPGGDRHHRGPDDRQGGRAAQGPRHGPGAAPGGQGRCSSERGYDPVLGARPLRRTIQREIEDNLSEKILFGELKAGPDRHRSMSRAPGRKRSSRSRACPSPRRCPTRRPRRSESKAAAGGTGGRLAPDRRRQRRLGCLGHAVPSGYSVVLPAWPLAEAGKAGTASGGRAQGHSAGGAARAAGGRLTRLDGAPRHDAAAPGRMGDLNPAGLGLG